MPLTHALSRLLSLVAHSRALSQASRSRALSLGSTSSQLTELSGAGSVVAAPRLHSKGSDGLALSLVAPPSVWIFPVRIKPAPLQGQVVLSWSHWGTPSCSFQAVVQTTGGLDPTCGASKAQGVFEGRGGGAAARKGDQGRGHPGKEATGSRLVGMAGTGCLNRQLK